MAPEVEEVQQRRVASAKAESLAKLARQEQLAALERLAQRGIGPVRSCGWSQTSVEDQKLTVKHLYRRLQPQKQVMSVIRVLLLH